MTAIRSLLLCSIVLAGCSYPASTVMQGGNDGSLYFPGAQAGVRVVLDGSDAGEAAAYDGKRALLKVKPGTHRVVLLDGSRSVFDKQVFVGADARLPVGN